MSATDLGTIIETDWNEVKIKWDDGQDHIGSAQRYGSS